jgi:hypothetical protein
LLANNKPVLNVCHSSFLSYQAIQHNLIYQKKHLFFGLTLLLLSYFYNTSMANTANSNLLISGVVVASCSIDSEFSVDMGSNIQAGELALSQVNIPVSCSSPTSWALRSYGSPAFTLGNHSDYYVTLFIDPERIHSITDNVGYISGMGNSAATVYIKVGRTVGPYEGVSLPIEDTGTFNVPITLFLSF